MSNFWHGVNYFYMCRQHINGVNKEIPQLLARLKLGHSITKHELDFQVLKPLIWESIVNLIKERDRRNYKTNSLRKYSLNDIIEIAGYQTTISQYEKGAFIASYNTAKLLVRCEQCQKQFEKTKHLYISRYN